MCSINGCVDFSDPRLPSSKEICAAGRRLARRGPDANGTFFAPSVGFYHNRLAVMDPAGGAQPMQITHGGVCYTIVYNGELYNTNELRKELNSTAQLFQIH